MLPSWQKQQENLPSLVLTNIDVKLFFQELTKTFKQANKAKCVPNLRLCLEVHPFHMHCKAERKLFISEIVTLLCLGVPLGSKT